VKIIVLPLLLGVILTVEARVNGSFKRKMEKSFRKIGPKKYHFEVGNKKGWSKN
jgi:hypothetical protein